MGTWGSFRIAASYYTTIVGLIGFRDYSSYYVSIFSITIYYDFRVCLSSQYCSVKGCGVLHLDVGLLLVRCSGCTASRCELRL